MPNVVVVAALFHDIGKIRWSSALSCVQDDDGSIHGGMYSGNECWRASFLLVEIKKK
jgi:hypothetical protein